MKNLLFTISLALFTTIAFSQNSVQDLVNKYKGQDDINVISISGNMFKLGSSFIDEDDKDAKVAADIAKQIDEMTIINTQSTAKGKELSKVVEKLIKTNNYEEMMTIDSEGDEVKFYGRIENNVIKEFFILVGENRETTLISMTGNINPKHVSELMKKADIH